MNKVTVHRWLVGLLVVVITASWAVGCSSKPATVPTPSPAAKPAPPPTVAKPSPAAKPPPTTAPAPSPVAKTGRVPFEQQQLQKYVVGQASAGGVAIVMVSALAQLISKYAKMVGSVTILPGFNSVVEYMRKGEIDYGHLTPVSPYDAYVGKLGAKLRLRWLAGQTGNKVAGAFVFVTLPKAGINSGADFKGKRLTYAPGLSWSLQVVDGVLKTNNLTRNDLTLLPVASNEESIERLKEGRTDMALVVAGTATTELARTRGLFVVPLTRKETDAILEINPALSTGMLVKGWMGIDDAKWGLITPGGYFLRADMNEKTVYTMADVLFSNMKEFQPTHQIASDYDLRTAADLLWNFPYHPGAIRYYKEKGVWTSEHTAKQKAVLEKEKKLYGNLLSVDEETFKELGVLP